MCGWVRCCLAYCLRIMTRSYRDCLRAGALHTKLLRPLDLYWFWFARTLAFRTAPTLSRMIPGIIFATLVLPLIGLPEWALPAPASVAHGLMFLMSFVVTVMLSCAITILITISMFWMIEGRGISTFMYGVVPSIFRHDRTVAAVSRLDATVSILAAFSWVV